MDLFFAPLIIFFSIVIFFIFCVEAFRFKTEKTCLLLNLSKRKVLFFFAFEILLFILIYTNYYFVQLPDAARSGFAWINLIIYGRGIFPAILVQEIDAQLFDFEHSTFAFFDYFVLFLISKCAKVNVKN